MSQKDERQLEMLKQEYKNILVPPQAKTRIQKGIDQAKKETKGVIIMKLFKNIGATAAAAVLIILLNCAASMNCAISLCILTTLFCAR